MIKDIDAFIAHLKKTGRMKLLPQALRELKAEMAKLEKLAPRKETARENPSLISGWLSIENGRLIDQSAKGALIDIYRNVTR